MSRTRLSVHVTTRSRRDEIVGWRGDELAVRVAAPPTDGRANTAVCALVAGVLGVPRSSVHVAHGHASRHKHLEVDGVSAEYIGRLIGHPGEHAR